MQATFQLESAELSKSLIDAIKKAFAGKKINIVVTEVVEDDSNTILEQKIQKATNSDVRYVFEGNDFATFTNQLLANEPVDVLTYKKTRKQ